MKTKPTCPPPVLLPSYPIFSQKGFGGILVGAILSLCGLGGLIIQSAAQGINEIPPEAYVVKYSFDDGNATDLSPNGDDGVIEGATTGEGKVGGALVFDGSDFNYVTVPDLGVYDQATVTAWIKVSGRVGDWRAIYNVDGWDTGWMHHQLYPDNRMGFSINGNPNEASQFSTSTYDETVLDEWHHSAVVYDTTEGVVRFYLDGELDREVSWLGGAAVLAPARIGNWDGGGRGFQGTIDEFAILNIAATADQVRNLAGVSGPIPLAEYSFDSGAATDESGNGKDATIVGARTATGELFEGLALEFDGSDSQYLEIPDLGTAEEFTIAMWIKPTGRVDDWRTLYSVNGWSEGWVHYQIAPDNGISLSISGNTGGDTQSSTTNFDAGQLDLWYHTAVAYSSLEQKVRFYLDGQLESEADWGGNSGTLGPARIGGWDGGGRGFQGLIDEVTIWKTAANERQVANLMGDARLPRPTGTVIAAYSFDDGTAADSSGNANDGMVFGAVPAAGKFGEALEFDGSDDSFITTPDLGSMTELTVATWFKMTGRTEDWRVLYSVNSWRRGSCPFPTAPKQPDGLFAQFKPRGRHAIGRDLVRFGGARRLASRCRGLQHECKFGPVLPRRRAGSGDPLGWQHGPAGRRPDRGLGRWRSRLPGLAR